MLDDEFNKQRAKILRDLAERADPFIKRRLLKLVERYEPKRRAAPIDQQFQGRLQRDIENRDITSD
ncbi:hypothetical protein [Bradyrhizobium sp. Ec3.3]|uniref:hypothetical protein n=1 Tax=Bradyrhizobium sp. Ec3.3 TaxID=189753 RepID=UPI0005581AC1|nr:hypothetical protein [Bradyrhizobium sp. Ec3.3]